MKDGNRAEVSDEDAVALAQREPARFDVLYRRYERQIYAFIRARVEGDAAHVEDLTSRVFAKALAGLASYRAGSFRGWLYRIARNVLIDDIRAHRPTVTIDAVSHLPDDAEHVDSHVMRRMQQATLWEALDVLTEAQRDVIDLRLQGLTARQIGERLALNPEAVKSAQYRAFARLQQHFERTGQIRREDL